MPSKPKHPCYKPGCNSLTAERYCEQHAVETRRYDQERGTSTERGYNSRWRKARLTFLRSHPLCECDDCKQECRLLPATVVDHIIPHRGDQQMFWDQSNWQAMSKRCHDRKTAREDGGFGNG